MLTCSSSYEGLPRIDLFAEAGKDFGAVGRRSHFGRDGCFKKPALVFDKAIQVCFGGNFFLCRLQDRQQDRNRPKLVHCEVKQ